MGSQGLPSLMPNPARASLVRGWGLGMRLRHPKHVGSKSEKRTEIDKNPDSRPYGPISYVGEQCWAHLVYETETINTCSVCMCSYVCNLEPSDAAMFL